MSVVRRVARPCLAAMFVAGGADAVINAKPKVPAAESVAPPVAARLPYLPEDTEALVKINGVAQMVFGLLLALGRFPRLSAAVLAGSLVPTTVAGHRFWEEDDPQRKANQRIHFFKNLSMFGGLLLAAADTEGQPGLAWRVQHAAHHASAGSRRTTKAARREARRAAQNARAHLPG